jgi:hypothetical protein
MPALAPVEKPALFCDTAKVVCDCDDVGGADVGEDGKDDVMADAEEPEDALVVVVIPRSEAWKLSCIKAAQRVYAVIVVVIAFAASPGLAVIAVGKVR